MFLLYFRSEEIPLEDFRQSRNSSPSSRCSSRATSRSHTPSKLGIETLSVTPQEPININVPVIRQESSESDPSQPSTTSRETSFIASRKKGSIETV